MIFNQDSNVFDILHAYGKHNVNYACNVSTLGDVRWKSYLCKGNMYMNGITLCKQK